MGSILGKRYSMSETTDVARGKLSAGKHISYYLSGTLVALVLITVMLE
jgi:hypothetical protein